MVKCEDGRKHVLVKGYRKKAGQTVSRYERSCPAKKTIQNEEEYTCCVCGEDYRREYVYTIPVKGEEKAICTGCADVIHGLL